MNRDKSLTNARAITGYSPSSVVEHIQELQERYKKDINSLKEKLLIEKEMNHKLKAEVEKLQSLPQNNVMEQEIKDMLGNVFEQHLLHTQSILDLRKKLETEEAVLLKELDLKTQQRSLAKDQLKGALQYFKTYPSPLSDFGKEKEK